MSSDLGCDYGKDSIFSREPGDYGLYEDENGYYVELYIFVNFYKF